MHELQHKQIQQDISKRDEPSSLATISNPMIPGQDLVHPMQASLGMTNCPTNESKPIDVSQADEPQESSTDECSCKYIAVVMGYKLINKSPTIRPQLHLLKIFGAC
jgi:hypothetical protein